MNNITIIGRLTRDPETRYLPTETLLARFIVAVDRDYKKSSGDYETDFIPVEVMGNTAEYVQNYISKGILIAVNGAMRIDRYDSEGQTRTFAKVAGKRVEKLSAKKEEPVGIEESSVNDAEVPF